MEEGSPWDGGWELLTRDQTKLGMLAAVMVGVARGDLFRNLQGNTESGKHQGNKGRNEDLRWADIGVWEPTGQTSKRAESQGVMYMPLTHAGDWSIQNFPIQFIIQLLNPKPAGTLLGRGL